MEWMEKIGLEVPAMFVLAVLMLLVTRAFLRTIREQGDRFLEALKEERSQFTKTMATVGDECHRVQDRATDAIHENTRVLGEVTEALHETSAVLRDVQAERRRSA